MWRIVTFEFTGKNPYAGTFAIEVDNSGVPITEPGNPACNFVNISGDEVENCIYSTGDVLIENKTLQGAGILPYFSRATENTVYTETEPAGTWSYVNATTYTIIASAGTSGSISPSSSVSVLSGEDQAFTITPSAGYKIASVLVDGTEAKQDLVNNVYTFTNVSADHTITATFEELLTYDIIIQTNCGTGAIGEKTWKEFRGTLNENLTVESSSYDTSTQIGTITITSTRVLPSPFVSGSGVNYIVSITLPDCFTEIEDDAFAGCSNMVSITLPSTVTNLGTLVFNGCTSLGKIIVNNPTPPTVDGGDLGVDGVEVDVPYGSGEAYQNAEGWSDQNINDPKPPTPTHSYGFNLSGMKNVDYGKQGVIILRN